MAQSISDYNEKLIKGTMEMSKRTSDKSKEYVHKLTHPSKKISKVGSSVGTIIGAILIILGLSKYFLGARLLGGASIFAGCTTILSNIYNRSKINNNAKQ